MQGATILLQLGQLVFALIHSLLQPYPAGRQVCPCGGDRSGFARFERDELVLIRAMGTGKGNFVLKRVPYGDILRLAFDPENNEWITIRLKTPGEPPEIKFSKKENRDRFLRLMSLHGIVHRSLQNAGPDKAE